MKILLKLKVIINLLLKLRIFIIHQINYYGVLRKHSIIVLFGIVIEYNEIGKAIKKTNYDKEYTFTIDELCDFIQDEYNVNIRRISDGYIKWDVKKIYEPILKKSCYRVDFYTPKPQVGEIYARKEIYIDSKTGKVLYEEDSFLFLEGGDLLPKSKTDFPKK